MNHASVAILAPDEMQVTVLPRRKGGMNMTQALDRNATISVLNRILELGWRAWCATPTTR